MFDLKGFSLRMSNFLITSSEDRALLASNPSAEEVAIRWKPRRWCSPFYPPPARSFPFHRKPNKAKNANLCPPLATTTGETYVHIYGADDDGIGSHLASSVKEQLVSGLGKQTT